MDLTVRDWMVIVGVLLIVAVLLDAWRRIRADRASPVKVKLVDPDTAGSERDADLAWLKELPNGGARVVERGDLLRAASAERERVAEAAGDDVPLVQGVSSADTADDNLDWLDSAGEQEPAQESEAGKLPRDPDPEVFMLNVVARDPAGFRGEDILHILLACDLRFGDMSFFHRHEFEAGRGAIQFSVANMMQPGVFDIDNMAQMNTPGLVFFLTLPGPEDMMKAYDYMLETAQAVARNLGGDVLDESRSVLTRQTTEHSRQQIRELERRLLAGAR
ncbi:MAG: cell division protein ZipA [Halioglobus sp.]|nr:cell division protein ZipA [Halioglobus sp.]|tara:strand:+ start:2202 stop:3029 length:828 start_codon:yes stop_codon:yes gene_type:complete